MKKLLGGILLSAAAFCAKAQDFSYKKLEQASVSGDKTYAASIRADLQQHEKEIFSYPDDRMKSDTNIVRRVQFIFRDDEGPAEAIVITNRIGVDDDYLDLKETYVDDNRNGEFETKELIERKFLSFINGGNDDKHILQLFFEFENGKSDEIEKNEKLTTPNERFTHDKTYPASALAEMNSLIGDIYLDQAASMTQRRLGLLNPTIQSLTIQPK